MVKGDQIADSCLFDSDIPRQNICTAAKMPCDIDNFRFFAAGKNLNIIGFVFCDERGGTAAAKQA